jgi:capsular exopolysaccharide synthesis family protein
MSAVSSLGLDEDVENRVADEFLERCAKPEWKPDAKSMLFFTGEGAKGSEAFRTLRSHLYEFRKKRLLKRLLITSALPGEGKTFIAANLAQVIVCQHGRRALLIDADLRRPRLHVELGAPSSPGLSDYLSGKADEVEIVQQGPLAGLFFIPGGSPATSPAELIAGPRMQKLLDAMSEHFDWIVIDSPPCLPVADPNILAAHVDGVLLVVQADITQQETAKNAKQKFNGNPLVGVVLNRVARMHSYDSYYGAYGATGRKIQESDGEKA